MSRYGRDYDDRRARARSGRTMLDCWFCGENYRDFTELSAHVRAVHQDSTLRSVDVDNRERRSQTTMAKSNARPNDRKSDDRREFLKVADLSRRGQTTIEFGDSIRTFDGKFGAQIIIDVTVNGHPFALGIKLNSANHIALEKKLGRNMVKWPGAKVKATVQSFDGDSGKVEYIELDGARDRERD